MVASRNESYITMILGESSLGVPYFSCCNESMGLHVVLLVVLSSCNIKLVQLAIQQSEVFSWLLYCVVISAKTFSESKAKASSIL